VVADTRWLTAPEQRAWRAYLESTKVVFEALDRELQRESDMPHAYFEVLVRLSEAPERSLRMSELAQLTLSSRSRLSHAVARLEERGWVQRTNCETDRRGQNATLTDAGFDVLAAAAPGHVDSVRRHVIDALSPAQLEQLAEIGELLVGRPSDEQ
jgi:DNA-binding MarR family transcriptional regulator